MNTKKKIAAAAVIAAVCVSMSSCSLLPEEETFGYAPVVAEYEQVELKSAPCTRGDMALTKTVSCTYVPVRTEYLKFGVSGVNYDEVFVNVGDSVVEGQLLAQLRLDSIPDNIASVERSLEEYRMKLKHNEENRQLVLKRQELKREGMTAEDYEEAVQLINESYDANEASINDSIDILNLRLETYNKDLQDRQLIAPMNGTVTYIKKMQTYDVSTIGEKMMSVADSTMSLFRAQTEYWDHFVPGDQYTITANKTEYEATVMSEAELGLAEQEKVVGQKAYVYFALNEPTFELEDNDKGTLVLVLDTREDVLMVPEAAIAEINGSTVVYFQNELGLREYKSVVTGLTANKYVEIIEGLSEGDIVVAE